MNNKVMIVAELSANHGQSIEIAKETIRAAKRAGADAIKFQTYKPETITLDCNNDDFKVSGGTIWDGRSLFELYQEAYTPWEWHKELFEVARNEGLVVFSTPFDFTAVDLLENLDCPIYKIASFEINDIPLIKYIASKGKPIIISTGIATREEIELALKTINDEGVNDITLLKCTSSYPAPIDQANLCMIQQYKKDFDVKVGLSDHTMGSIVPMMSIAMGAEVIEKHFILDKKVGGPDASFSMDEAEFKQMVEDVRNAELSLGHVSYNLTKKQISSRKYGRSLYISKDVKKGDVLTKDNIKSVRPSMSLHPGNYFKVLGKQFKKSFKLGDRFNLEDVE
ncbi:MAG: pseudaminic acid synthase [Marinifilaceae bacterium]|jgi:pseudaminic acid synthase|nr:pseudaminic acid synthase [Marinifilaceae bacterium]